MAEVSTVFVRNVHLRSVWDDFNGALRAVYLMSRPAEELAREVRHRTEALIEAINVAEPWQVSEAQSAYDAALAELQAQAEAGRRVKHILENIADPYNERIGRLKQWANEAMDVLAAAAPPPADTEATICVESEDCEAAEHFWRCPRHHLYEDGSP